MTVAVEGIKIAIDRGGTFTDVIAKIPGEDDLVFKLLSVDPENYEDANVEAIRRVLTIISGHEVPKNQPLDISPVSSIRLGTTVATNALLERKGARTAFLTTKGFRDFLRIGDQSRPQLFAMHIHKPDMLYDEVVEIEERVTCPDYAEDPDEETFDHMLGADPAYVKGETNQIYRVIQDLDVEDTKRKLAALKEKNIESVGICLLHGYNFTKHEKQVKELALEAGFKFVTTSHELMPMMKMLPRAQSVVVEAYLCPIIKKYTASLLAGFVPGFEKTTSIEFMHSDGGLVPHSEFSALRALLSGPAGGVVGIAQSSYNAEDKVPIVGFDMGGTSTDVSRFDGSYHFVFHSLTAGVQVAVTQLDINTVAAGGGSILSYTNGIFKVGPESASSHPGPACYRKGGPLTVTDANLYTGKIIPEFFPHIFGPNENESLDFEIVDKKFKELAVIINKENPEAQKTPHEIALGFLEVANQNMAKPIRALTESRGHRISKHNLAAFGGAGGQNCNDVAQILNIKRVVIHKYSSILSAYGIGLANTVKEIMKPCDEVYDIATRDDLMLKCDKIKADILCNSIPSNVDKSTLKVEYYLNMGYKGSETRLMIQQREEKDFLDGFKEEHQRQFAFLDDTKDVLVHDLRVRVSYGAAAFADHSTENSLRMPEDTKPSTAKEVARQEVWFSKGKSAVPLTSSVYEIPSLEVGTVIHGPAILLDKTQTICVNPNSKATVLANHIIIDIDYGASAKVETKLPLVADPILLAVFQNRFMAIAEEMGTTLEKVSVSVTIKERLDFSCALFDEDGNLTANAPHVPVHLGSMSHCIKYSKAHWGSDIHPGDILASNHPRAGGTHLPDVTLISPVFIDGKIRFFTASRAHHMEIGGSVPGSCSSDATELFQEGAQFKYWRIVHNGVFDYAGFNRYFLEEPAQYPGCSGTRNYKDNMSDLKAQIAANQKGLQLVHELFNEYGTEVVLFYMSCVRKTAALAVRNFLKATAREMRGQLPLKASEILDDGSVIKVSIDIDEDTGDAFYDFTGTSIEAYNPCNAPAATTYACIIYSLRLMLDSDIPLNEGCLEPVSVYIPDGTILSPSEFAAVAAANSTTAQRLNDTLLKAFGKCAASNGSNNTYSFGKGGKDPVTGISVPGFAMGETVGGGSGACMTDKGEGFPGFSAVHCHMTNTRVTDPESYEKRYPVILHEFSVRPNSGGRGKWRGGDGIVRHLEFTTDLEFTIRTQRRVNRPYGIKGGEPGAMGENILGKIQGGKMRWIHLPSFCRFTIKSGEHFRMLTPGGGGYGKPEDEEKPVLSNSVSQKEVKTKLPGFVSFQPLAGGTLAERVELANTSQ